MGAFGLILAAILFAAAAFLLTNHKDISRDGFFASPPRAQQTIPKPAPAQPKQEVERNAMNPSKNKEPESTDREAPSTTTAVSEPERSSSAEPVPHQVTSSTSDPSWSEFSRGNPNSPKIALTFDAGWENKPGEKILDTLAEHGVQCTFFLTGKWVEKNQELTRRIADSGHEIGNHTYSHKSLTNLSAGQIADEAEKTEQLIVKITGRSTKPLLRVPYGSRDKRVLAALQKLGYRSIYWDMDCHDSVKPGITASQIEQRVLAKVRKGSVVLMHIGSSPTADCLDSLLTKLKEAGYQPVTVSELMGH